MSRKIAIEINHKLSFIDSLIGSKTEYSFKQRFFHITCLIVVFFWIFRLLYGLILKMDLIPGLLNIILSSTGILITYFISRFAKLLTLSTIIFLFILLISFSYNWFYTGGVKGGMPFFYIGLFIIFMLISKEKYRHYLLLIILINISVLLYLEQTYPHLINQSMESHIPIQYFYLVFAFILTYVIIQIAKILFRNQNVKSSSLDLLGSDEIDFLKDKLTNREREIFELKLEGKKNRQIAAMLFIDICTVKTHVNNIHKKLGHNCCQELSGRTMKRVS